MPLEPVHLIECWPALGSTERVEFVGAGPATASLKARLSRGLTRTERLVAWTRFGAGKWHDVETSWDEAAGLFVADLHFSSCVDAIWTLAVRSGRQGRETVWLGAPDVNARFALVAVAPPAPPSERASIDTLLVLSLQIDLSRSQPLKRQTADRLATRPRPRYRRPTLAGPRTY